MKWLAVLLVLANVASHFWIQRQGSIELDLDPNRFEGVNLERMSIKFDALDSTKSSGIEDVVTRIDLTKDAPDAEPIELVGVKARDAEAQSKEVLEPKRGAVEVMSPMPSIDQKLETDLVEKPEPEVELEAVAGARLCYRVGPYTAQGALDNAVAVISNQNIEFAVTETYSERQVKAARVYLGPFPTDDVMQSMRARLKEQRVDHFVVNIDGQPRLQLGYFSGLSRGQNYQKWLVTAGFDAKLDKIYKAKLSDAWINFELQSEKQLVSLNELKFYRVASIEKRSCS